MKYKFNKMIYEIAMIELLINDNDSTDLGKYRLEYTTGYSDIGVGDMSPGNAAYTVGVRLVDKKSERIVWGNIYHKVLKKFAYCYDVREELYAMVDELYASSTEDKLRFITKPETITGREFKTDSLVTPRFAKFMKNLNHSDRFVEIDSAVSLNGRFPKDSLLEVNDVYNSLLESIQNQKKL